MKKKYLIQWERRGSTVKAFNHDASLSDQWRERMMVDIFPDFAQTIAREHYLGWLPLLNDFIEEHDILEKKKEALQHNLFWSHMCFEAYCSKGDSFIDLYIEANYPILKNEPLAISWLKEWSSAVPNFYYVGHKLSDRVLILVDMLTEETVDVLVYDPTAVPPTKGSIVAGTLLPLGDNLYFPIVDFYHFELEARRPIGLALRHHYEKYSHNASLHETFLDVLSVTLQIEHVISTSL